MNTLDIETLIATNLLHNESFSRSVAPYLKTEFFEQKSIKVIYSEFDKYLKEYNAIPTKEALYIEIEVRTDLDQSEIDSIVSKLAEINEASKEEAPDQTWLHDTTEKYCKDRALYLAITDAIGIIDGSDKKRDKNCLPELLTEALGVSFDEYIGHDFLEQADQRWDFYHKKESRLEFGLSWLNQITDGGLPRKTLNVFLAGCVHPDTEVEIELSFPAFVLMKITIHINNIKRYFYEKLRFGSVSSLEHK